MLRQFTPERQALVFQAVAEGLTPPVAMVQAGIPARTAQMWLAIMEGRQTRYTDGTPVSAAVQAFLAPVAEGFATARAVFEAKIARRIVAAAETVNEKTGIPEWRAGAWLFEHHPAYKRDYAEYRELKVASHSTVSHEHRYIRDLPLTDVIDIVAEADPEFAALVQPARDSSHLSPPEHE